jgi:hypothetical protein
MLAIRVSPRNCHRPAPFAEGGWLASDPFLAASVIIVAFLVCPRNVRAKLKGEKVLQLFLNDNSSPNQWKVALSCRSLHRYQSLEALSDNR